MASQQQAKDAIFTSIESTAKNLLTEYSSREAAPGLRDLAYAWRALAGGSQPGSVSVEK